MIIRTHKEDGKFFMMHKHPIESAELSWKAKGILTYLMSKPSDWTIRISDLVKHSADGEGALRNGLAEMERAGYLVKRRENDKNGLFNWVCVVYETPVPPEERSNPDDRKLTQPRKKSETLPFARNPQMDNPEMENRYPTNNDGTKNNGTNNDKEQVHACEAQASASQADSFAQEQPAQDSLPAQESLPLDEYPPVDVSAECKDSIATLFDAAPVSPAEEPPAAAPPAPPAPNKNALRLQLEEHFAAKTKLPRPPTNTIKQKKSAGALWWTPLREIAELVEWDVVRAEKLIDLTVDHFRRSKLTIANPNSIVKTAGAILTGNVPGVSMPHVKRLKKYVLVFPDGHTEEVEEYV